jgi:hypothetical protein
MNKIYLCGLVFLTGCAWTGVDTKSPFTNEKGYVAVDQDGNPALRESKIRGYALFQGTETAKVKLMNGEWNKDKQTINSDQTAQTDAVTQMKEMSIQALKSAENAYLLGQSKNSGGGMVTYPINITTNITILPNPPAFVDTNSSTWPFLVTNNANGDYVVCWPNGACVIVPRRK